MNPADLTLTISPNLTNRPAPPPLSITPKNGRLPVPRVDLEPIYLQLKAALGDGWNAYKDAVGKFVCGTYLHKSIKYLRGRLGVRLIGLIAGTIDQRELSHELQPLLSAAPSVITSTNTALSPVSTLHLHNTLLTALYANTLRDPPPTDVAPWVVATDKPSTTSKTAGAGGANDKAEERLKKEVMSIHPRDRRRIKTLKEPGRNVSDGFAEMLDFRAELAVKPPDVGNTAGVGRTNWDIDIRRRYQQQLAEENLEFPTTSDIQNRIEPICYEEGLVGGVAQGVLQGLAEIMEQATEVFLKELVGALYSHSRANGEGCILTQKYRKQLRAEEDWAERGVVQRSAAGLLPVEMEAQSQRQGLRIEDMALALQLEDTFMRQDRFLGQKVALHRYPDLKAKKLANGVFKVPKTNGVLERRATEDAMAVDEDLHWRGASKSDAEDLMKVLDECLAVG